MKNKILIKIIFSTICFWIASCGEFPTSDEWIDDSIPQKPVDNKVDAEFAKREQYSYEEIVFNPKDYHETISNISVVQKDGYTFFLFNIGIDGYEYYVKNFDENANKSYIWIQNGKVRKEYREIDFLGYNYSEEKWKILDSGDWTIPHTSRLAIMFEGIPEGTERISLYIDQFKATIKDLKLVPAKGLDEEDNDDEDNEEEDENNDNEDDEDYEDDKERELYSYKSTTATENWDNIEIVDVDFYFSKTIVRFKLGKPGKSYYNDKFYNYNKIYLDNGNVYRCLGYPGMDYLTFDSDYIWEYYFESITENPEFIDLYIAGFDFWVYKIKVREDTK